MSGHTKTDLRRGRLPARQGPATTQDEQDLLLTVERGTRNAESSRLTKPSARSSQEGHEKREGSK